MDGEDGEESDLQLLHPLSVSPPSCGLHERAFPMAFGIWGTCICRMQPIWLLDYFSLPWFPGITVLPALLLPPDVDLSSQLFPQHVVSSECWHPLTVLAGHQGHLVLRL